MSIWAQAATYSPTSVPNPRIMDNRWFVSNPDHILSEHAASSINSICLLLQQQTEAELAVVAITDMDSYDADDFAQRLFNHWGIGAKDKNTGVLILLVTGSRDIRIHTGGGLEGLLPDITCDDILDQMVPALSQGDWDNGLYTGAHAILNILTTDEAKAELLLGFVRQTNEASDFITGYLILGFILLILLSIRTYSHTNLPKTDPRRDERLTNLWTGVVLCAIFLPLPMAWLAWWLNRLFKKIGFTPTPASTQSSGRSMGGGYRGGSFGSGSFGRGGFGGGSFSGGSFGGGVSFGGGAGRKF